jgi:hypothetical protein
MWIETVVMPRHEPTPCRSRARRDRRAVYEAACAESRRFREQVLKFLQAHHLSGAVRWVSEPGSLPMVTLHCTPQVLEQLRQAPHFEAGATMPLELHC